MPLDVKDLERTFFPFVEKPNRYTGGELNLPPLPEQPILRVALAFPDLYELGMSYLGLRILLHRASQVEGIACERVFMPWFDAANRLRQLPLPLFTLETRTPLYELDLIGFNLQYELHATNILAMLELGRIPLFAADRRESDPLILGGGPLASHCEAFAPFFEAIAVGDGEEVFPAILETLKSLKQAGASRLEKIRALGGISGLYVPAFYQPQYGEQGTYGGLKPAEVGFPSIIEGRVIPELIPDYYPAKPLVPRLEITHNRLTLEISRGCSRGCRFCGPGMINRPVRERPLADLVQEAEIGLSNTGFAQLSLLSLSTGDYRGLEALLAALEPILDRRRVSLSFPSLRPERFTPQVADRAAAGARTGLTLAPEAATPRLRAVINKDTSDEALLQAVRLAYERQWKSVKLYFMIGLPTETDEDVLAMVELIRQVVGIGREFGGRGISVSVSPFVPKPHTPFEREGQLPPADLQRRLNLLRSGLRRFQAVRLELRDLEITLVESAIARGDRRMAKAIEISYRHGGLFDAWSDGFSFPRWQEALVQAGLSLENLVRPLPKEQILPWEHLNPGVTREFLQGERAEAAQTQFTPDCRGDVCHLCGLQQRTDLPCPEIPDLESYKLKPNPEKHENLVYTRYRLKYRRTDDAKYVSHLDALGILERALRRLGMPLEFTAGMKPHPRLIVSPPLGMGMTSQAEYLDFGIGGEWQDEPTVLFRKTMPPGFETLQVYARPQDKFSLGGLNKFLYQVTPISSGAVDWSQIETSAAQLWAAPQLPSLRHNPGKVRAFDARPTIWKIETAPEGRLYIGLISRGGPLPKPTDILLMLINSAERDPLSNWKIDRSGMWWGMDNESYSPEAAESHLYSRLGEPSI